MQNKSALIVDDSRVARMTLKKFLNAHGFEITEHGSGEEALEWLKTTDAKPDIIFMDVMMEGMDGLTATRQIKATPELLDIPVIICTGNDSDADLSKALETGAEAVLSKPPASEAVDNILNQVASKTPPPAEPKVETVVAPAPVIETVTAEIDEAALITKALAAFKEQSLPELQRQVREVAEDISRQIAHEVAQETSHSQSESLLPELSRKAAETVAATIQQAKQQVEKSAQDLVSRAANTALEKALQDYGLTEKLMVTLHSEGATWLKKQEQPIRDSLQKQLQEQLSGMVGRYLDVHLAEKVMPLVKSLMAEHQAEADLKSTEQLAALRKQASLATLLGAGAAVVAVIAVALNFI